MHPQRVGQVLVAPVADDVVALAHGVDEAPVLLGDPRGGCPRDRWKVVADPVVGDADAHGSVAGDPVAGDQVPASTIRSSGHQLCRSLTSAIAAVTPSETPRK